MKKIIVSLIISLLPMLILAQSYPSETGRGDVVETYVAHDNAIEIGLANASNARRAWMLSRHANTSTYGKYYSTFHIQPDIGNRSEYRGLAIGLPANYHVPIGTGLEVKGKVRFHRVDGSNFVDIFSDIDGNYFTTGDPGTNHKNLYIRVTSAEGAGRHLFFQTGVSGQTMHTRMVIRDHGNIGIGTTSPTHKLEVNGTVRAKEVKLEATNWPDYVFDEGYGLMSLEEVKAHIDQKGHLPGLKPAKEYEEEGVNMLELNRKLLEKIEELTLHLINQHSVIWTQKEKLAEEHEMNIDQGRRIDTLEMELRELRKSFGN